MEPRLSQNQSQKQILSPQIRQYLKLLQMPLLELEQAIDIELTENPMLEETVSAKKEESLPEDPAPTPIQERDDRELDFGENFQNLEKLDDNFKNSDIYTDPTAGDQKELQKKRDFKETLITRPETLHDFLLWQVRFLDLTDEEKKIAEEIIGNINDDGYLKASLEEIATACHADLSHVEKILSMVQQFDPAGIGARNLQESLLIQLTKKGPDTFLATEIVAKHLPLLEKRNWPAIAKVLSVDIEKIKEAASIIAHLDPKPGKSFHTEDSLVVTPEAAVTFDDNGKIKIEIFDETLPELRLNAYYRRLMRIKTTDAQTRNFLREKMHRALNFLKAIKLRKSTLREITEEIVKAQRPFFEKGFSHLMPLRLKDIAQTIGIHESTVSRAIHGKYLSTPQGTIAYKSFFSTKLDTTTGESESQKSIMEKVKKLVDNESPQKPLSDQELVSILKNEGIMIARRTVAKYRDLLKILPSHLRRKR